MSEIHKVSINDFKTGSGALYKSLDLFYQHFGKEYSKAPVVLVNHSLTGDSNVSGNNGWWSEIIGPGMTIDTNHYSVLAFNIPGNGFQDSIIKNHNDFHSGDIARLFFEGLRILGDKIKPNDVIIGVKSSGLHSNGYSLARKVLSKYSLKQKFKGVGVLGDALLKPTEIYVKPVLEAIEKCSIHGLAHITGGSFTKLLRLKQIGFELDNLPKTPPLMQLIQDCGVKSDEMYKTFNMGVGFCVISPENQVKKIRSIFKNHKMTTYEIGHISKKKGVFVNSKKIA